MVQITESTLTLTVTPTSIDLDIDRFGKGLLDVKWRRLSRR